MTNSRIDELRMVDPVLTSISQGYTNASFVSEKLFPLVTVSKLKGKIPMFGREAFISRDTNRAFRAKSNRISPTDITHTTFTTQEQDIEMAIDYLESEESYNFYKYEQKVAKQLTDILLLNREVEAANIVQDPDNFESDLKLELDENTAFNNYSTDSDPIYIIKQSMMAIRERIGRYPNTMVIGDSAYQALLRHPAVIEKIKYSGNYLMNTSVLSQLTDIPSVNVGLAVYSADGEEFTDIWKDNVVLAYSSQAEGKMRSEFNPSFGYTFRREAAPQVDTYFENGGKIKVIRCTDNYCIKVTSADAAFLIYSTLYDFS